MKGVFNMFYRLVPGVACDGDNIKSYGKINAMILDISISRIYGLVYLGISNSFNRITIAVCPTRFDLYNNQHPRLLCHNI